MVEQASTIVADDTADTTTADTATTTAATTTAADAGKVAATTADTTAAATTADTTTATDDWRARIAGDDTKLAGYLARIPSEKALAEQVKRYNDDLKAGKLVKPLPENPTDEELAAHRKAQGVPDKPDAYMTTLPDGLVVGDDDKPFVDQFLGSMHKAGAPPAMVNAAIESYYAIVDEQAAAQAEMFATAKEEGQITLREEWGPDYRRNLNIISSFAGTLPEAVREMFLGKAGEKGRFSHATMPDGTPVGSNPEVLRWLASVAMELNPTSTVVPGAGTNQASAIADEIATIEGLMRTNRAQYNADDKMQARYRELIDARLKLEGKS